MKKKIDNKRNSRIVGHNSKSYNDKHPTNPVALRPIHDACMRVPKLFDPIGFAYPDDKTIRKNGQAQIIHGWILLWA